MGARANVALTAEKKPVPFLFDAFKLYLLYSFDRGLRFFGKIDLVHVYIHLSCHDSVAFNFHSIAFMEFANDFNVA